MKQYWQKIALKIDAMSEREAIMLLVMAVAVLFMLLNALLLNPLYAKKKLLTQRIAQDQAQITTIQTEIQQKMTVYAFDPDAANRARLKQVKQQAAQLQASLLDMQKGLVPPDKMSSMLRDILKRDGQLRLVTLKTLSATTLNEQVQDGSKMPVEKVAAAVPAKGTAESVAAVGGVYKHGVEIVVQGSYLDMMRYMTELEALPWQLFWGKVSFRVETYPQATLTLTLFTLSLDKKWLSI